ncbi:hypothetical protein EON83_23465 [bacterium]|nr:MAG: hypothetical protein EON83_23465 [bacterium]
MMKEFDLPAEITNALAVAPLEESRFVGFGESGLFVVDEEKVTPICPASLPVENDMAWVGHHLAPRIHLSPSGRFAAVCHDFGRFGFVADLQEKRVTMTLDRGDYHPETQFFPVAFFQNRGSDLLVHASDWNRLEISNPQTGELLTARDAMVCESQSSPEHYLDYFHGGLFASPDGKWIADDGWVWHPVGDVAVWSLEKWLNENVYESEDGISRRSLCWREYLWNVPIAWVDHEHLAVWGLGDDDADMTDGARIFDVSSGDETAAFMGPGKNAFFGGDGRLFSVEDDGLRVWDASTGEQLGRVDDFKPRWQRGDFLIELSGNRAKAWNWRLARA